MLGASSAAPPITGETVVRMDSARTEVEMRVVFVHGACVRDGAWWWHRTAGVLRSRGVASSAAPLPNCGEGDGPASAHGVGLIDDIAAVHQVLQGSGAGSSYLPEVEPRSRSHCPGRSDRWRIS